MLINLKNLRLNQLVQLFTYILIFSFPLSLSGTEVGRYGLLLCLILIPIHHYVFKSPITEVGINYSPDSYIYPSKLSKIEHHLRQALPYLLLVYVLLYVLSFINTKYWGDMDNGSLEHITVFLLPTVVGWMVYKYFSLDNLGKYIKFILGAFFISNLYSIYGVHFQNQANGIGFYFHTTVYSKVLAVEYTLILSLIFLNFKRYKSFYKNKKTALEVFSLLILLLLFSYDMHINQSRILLIILVVIPCLLVGIYNRKKKRLLLFLPFIAFTLIYLSPDSIKRRILHELHIEVRAPQPLDFELKSGLLKVSLKEDYLPYKTDKTWLTVRVKDEVNDDLLYQNIYSEAGKKKLTPSPHSQYLVGRGFEASKKYTVDFQGYFVKNHQPWHIDAKVVCQKSNKLLGFKVIKNMEFVRLPLSDLRKIPSLLHQTPTSYLSVDAYQMSRRLIYRSTISMIKKHPWLGNGPGTWKNFVTNIDRNDFAHEYLHVDDNSHYHPHNNFLHVCYNSGIFATLILCWFYSLLILASLLFVLRSMRQPQKHPYYEVIVVALFSFISLNIVGLFDNTVYDTVSGSFLWLLVGLLMKK